MSGGFTGQRSTPPWMGDAAAATSSEPAAGDVREYDSAASTASTKDLGSSSTNASAISFGFAATAILISMFLLMAIFEHLIKPGWASSSSRAGSQDGNDGDDGHNQPPHSGQHLRDDGSPGKLPPPPKMEEAVVVAADLTVVMPGQRYPTFLAQPAPLLPCPREGLRWPLHLHEHRRSIQPPWMNSV